jgi:hypothetical protein
MAYSKTPEFVSFVVPCTFTPFSPSRNSQNKILYAPLAEIDPEVKNIIDKETWRQFTGLELIASEVCCFQLFRTIVLTRYRT